MRQVRIFILVLLAVLLPVRGAVAATMLCSGSAVQIAAGPAAAQGHQGEQANRGMHASHGGADRTASDHHDHHHPDPAGSDDDAPLDGHTSTCNCCASACCMATVVGTVPTVARPNVTSELVFPALVSPIAAFHSGGQDRPPRTL